MNRRFALFADCLLLGVFTALAALPVVTAYPAFVAACSMLREETPVGPRTYLRCLRAVLRSDSLIWWVPTCALAIAAADAIAIGAGVPGAKPLAALLSLATAGTVVVSLRSAALWRAGHRWRSDLLTAAREAATDLGGSALLLLAAATAAAIVVMVPITALLVTGPLALAAVAVESRHRTAAPRPAAPFASAPLATAPRTASPFASAPRTASPVAAAPLATAPRTASPVVAAPAGASPVAAAPAGASPAGASPAGASPAGAAPAGAAPLAAVRPGVAPVGAGPLVMAERSGRV